MMMKDNAIAALLAGANIRTKVGMKDNMVAIAIAAKRGGTHVTFVGACMRDTMVAVASSAPRHVTFDDSME
jgi:hypothetical protein